MKNIIVYVLLIIALTTSCETTKERSERIELDRINRLEQEQIQIELAKEKDFKLEQERIKQEIIEKEAAKEIKIQLKKEKNEKAIHDKYINNSLSTGSTPYSYCFGKNYTCSDYGCSQIKVKTPYNSDVLVTIKKNGKVYRHAYINSGSNFTFEFPNGTYQVFFYYGKGWNPNKFMKNTSCGILNGGFISNELFGKDTPQILNNSVLSYELILQQNGNFSTKPSNANEAF